MKTRKFILSAYILTPKNYKFMDNIREIYVTS